MPEEELNWDPSTEGGKARLERGLFAFMQALRAGARKPTVTAKASEVLQKPEESPATFPERLCEGFRAHTPPDPRAPEDQRSAGLRQLLWGKHKVTKGTNSRNWKSLLGKMLLSC